jgi:iron complex transport system ATP-binding protein
MNGPRTYASSTITPVNGGPSVQRVSISEERIGMNQAKGSPVLDCRGLSAGYRTGGVTTAVARDLDVSLHAGEFVCLLGPNGAGKSTLMRTISAMQPPLAGEVLLNGDNVHRLSPRDIARQLSVVLTDRVTSALLTAYELVALGRHPFTDWTGRLTAHDHAIIRDALQAVGADDLAHRHVGELSDGERQKVMTARALAQEPRVMILDEITAFLDLPRRVEIVRILRSLAHERQRAVLLSTHDLELALRAADRIWLLAKGGAFITGTPEELVLSGAFQATFSTEGVQFDPHSGAFRLQQHTAGDVAVHGDGLTSVWTRRALERVGFRIVDPGSPSALATVEVHTVGGATLWQATIDGAATHHDTLDALVGAVRDTLAITASR